jgi:hypothetical protein
LKTIYDERGSYVKLTSIELKKIIAEELQNVINEGKCWDGYAPGAQTGVKTKESPTKTGERVKNCEEILEDFEPHMMYNPETGKGIKAMTHGKHLSLKNKGYVHDKPDVDEARKKKKKKPCKKAKGKKFVKRVNGRCRSYGQAGKAKDGGARIRPGTKKGDAYCARSAKIKKCKKPPCANALSRKKWKCRGSKSMREE